MSDSLLKKLFVTYMTYFFEVLLSSENKDFLLQPCVEYFQGVSILTIFTILAITSNNWSVKRLKANWKKLHQLTYLVIFLIPWHILDKMSGHWSYLTPLGILFSITTIVLFLRRRCIEVVELKRKQETKENTKALEEV